MVTRHTLTRYLVCFVAAFLAIAQAVPGYVFCVNAHAAVSYSDYLEYDFNSPRPFDLTIGITRCDEFLNSTTWTGKLSS